MQDTILHLRHDPVPVLPVARTDRHRFLPSLAKIKIDASANLYSVKIPDRPLLRIRIADNRWILRKTQYPGQNEYNYKQKIFHDQQFMVLLWDGLPLKKVTSAVQEIAVTSQIATPGA
jgi:hypothetical protein